MDTFIVKYHAGTYSGQRTVRANDEDEAISKVRAMIRREMTLPMYSDSYRIKERWENDDEEE